MTTETVQTVSELTLSIQQTLRGGYGSVRVRGEISNLRRQSSGHIYFSLKDDRSQIPAVLFRGNALRTDVEPRDGMEVLAEGGLDVYLPRGSYQLIVRSLVESGLGRLQQEFLRLKTQLEREGLFDPAHRKPIPVLPGLVALITSPTGAAIRDMLSVFQRRGWRGRLLILPALVQGEGAISSLVRQLRWVSESGGGIETVIVSRGGGSLEDLWAFNSEEVVRAVAACPVPVISAVGHETDIVLTDFAADRRAETPTAAAELITSAFVERVEALRHEAQRLGTRLKEHLAAFRTRVEVFQERLHGLTPARQFENWSQRVDELERSLGNRLGQELARRRDWIDHRADLLRRLNPAGRIEDERRRTVETLHRLDRALEGQRSKLRDDLAGWEQRLEATSLPRILRRGFAIVRTAEKNRLVASAEGIEPETPLKIDLAKGVLHARVERGEASMPLTSQPFMQRIYHHPKCGTCQKAAAWLQRKGIPAEWIDIREQPPGTEELQEMLKVVGRRGKLLNTSGMEYRKPGMKDRIANLSDGDLCALLAANGMLIKRPFVLGEGRGLTGFREAEWAAFFGVGE